MICDEPDWALAPPRGHSIHAFRELGWHYAFRLGDGAGWEATLSTSALPGFWSGRGASRPSRSSLSCGEYYINCTISPDHQGGHLGTPKLSRTWLSSL